MTAIPIPISDSAPVPPGGNVVATPQFTPRYLGHTAVSNEDSVRVDGTGFLDRLHEMGPEEKGGPVKPYQPMDAVAEQVAKFDKKYSQSAD